LYQPNTCSPIRAESHESSRLKLNAFRAAHAKLLKTQFLTEEDMLDVPERLPRFAFSARAEVMRVN
jgi:hypothetical protein